MSKVKHRKDHKQKLNNFKKKQMSKQQTTQVSQMPEIRNIPTWDKDAKIELYGYEWEVLYNSIASLQILQQVSQGVMSRNVLNGTVKMDFQKLDPKTLQYVDMTDEEKEPYKKDFSEMIQKIKEQQAQATQSDNTSVQPEVKNEATDEPKVDDVDTDSLAEGKVNENENEGAKVVQMS